MNARRARLNPQLQSWIFRNFLVRQTRNFSYNVVSDPVSLFDFNATILHCRGIDHKKFTYPFQGLDMRLTGVEPCGPVKQLLA